MFFNLFPSSLVVRILLMIKVLLDLQLFVTIKI